MVGDVCPPPGAAQIRSLPVPPICLTWRCYKGSSCGEAFKYHIKQYVNAMFQFLNNSELLKNKHGLIIKIMRLNFRKHYGSYFSRGFDGNSVVEL